jgi:hypothetical protein
VIGLPCGAGRAVLPDVAAAPPDHRRKREGIFVMAATIELLRGFQKDAAGLCAVCLSDDIARNARVLGDLLDIAENMSAIRHTSSENEELYQKAFAEVMAAVMLIAVFSAEMTRRAVLFTAEPSVN